MYWAKLFRRSVLRTPKVTSSMLAIAHKPNYCETCCRAESGRKENHMSTDPTQQFDPLKYKETTREQWQTAAEPWHRWGPTLEEWLGQATEVMLEMAEVGPGARVLDVAAGAGGQTIAAAKRVGSTGYVLATDISSNILEFAFAAAQEEEEGLTNVDMRVMDGEELEEELEEESFDAVIC